MSKRIEGIVKYIDLEGGFWGIVDKEGRNWFPLNFPEQLKTEGAEVTLTLREMPDQASAAMWGTPVRILSFHTLGPKA